MGIGNNGGDGRCGRGGSDVGQQTVADKGEVRIYCCSYFLPHNFASKQKLCYKERNNYIEFSFKNRPII